MKPSCGSPRDDDLSSPLAVVAVMTEINDGGHAFPGQPAYGTPAGVTVVYGQRGMSLRDWFAGQIAFGMAAHSGTQGLTFGPGEIATRSYEVADAMLKAREVKP